MYIALNNEQTAWSKEGMVNLWLIIALLFQ